MKPDIRGLRILTPAELRARRENPPKKKKKRQRRLRLRKMAPGRATVVTSVSVPPELKYRAARELGQGNFSAAVVHALTQCLLEIDRARGKNSSAPT